MKPYHIPFMFVGYWLFFGLFYNGMEFVFEFPGRKMDMDPVAWWVFTTLAASVSTAFSSVRSMKDLNKDL